MEMIQQPTFSPPPYVSLAEKDPREIQRQADQCLQVATLVGRNFKSNMPLHRPYLSESQQIEDTAAMFELIFAAFSRMSDVWFRMFINSCNNAVWTKFSLLTYTSPTAPAFLPEYQRKACNPKIIEVFCKVMENYRNAKTRTPHFLSYTQYTLEGENFNQLCHNALCEGISQQLANTNNAQLGTPLAEKNSYRQTLSSQFIRAAFSVIQNSPNIHHICISGPILENDRIVILDQLMKLPHISQVDLELETESAEYFLPRLTKLLNNPHITHINFLHMNRPEAFGLILDETWDGLRAQNQSAIAFINISPPSMPHNKLSFSCAL